MSNISRPENADRIDPDLALRIVRLRYAEEPDEKFLASEAARLDPDRDFGPTPEVSRRMWAKFWSNPEWVVEHERECNRPATPEEEADLRTAILLSEWGEPRLLGEIDCARDQVYYYRRKLERYFGGPGEWLAEVELDHAKRRLAKLERRRDRILLSVGVIGEIMSAKHRRRKPRVTYQKRVKIPKIPAAVVREARRVVESYMEDAT